MPPRNHRNGHIEQEVRDISDADQLLRYAAASQLVPLLRRGFTQERIAQGAGLALDARNAGPKLAKALATRLTADQLRGLDEIVAALAADSKNTGGLSSLAWRLSPAPREKAWDSSLAVRIPPGWTRDILSVPAGDEASVLTQASALLSEFMAAGRMDAPGALTNVCARYSKETERLVRQLVLISVAPPTSKNHDAQILLGMLASYAFSSVKGHLDDELRYSPMSFRVWRAITKLVMLSGDSPRDGALTGWVRRLVRDAARLRAGSLYAGRCLDLELAITVPDAWLPPGEEDWASDALSTRAWDAQATVRERGTAAMGLWQRAVRRGGTAQEKTKQELRELITELTDPGARADAAAGLRWVAATLEHAIDSGEPVCNDWPEVSDPWFRHVTEAAEELNNAGIPPHLLTGTKNLFHHMILQNAGVYRRQALETLVTSGWGEPVARSLGTLLATEQEESWLRIRAEFALGFLQQPDMQAEEDLIAACEHARQSLQLDGGPEGKGLARAHITEMHTALFAVGDCFGVPGVEERTVSVRERLLPIVADIAGTVTGARARALQDCARAAAYMLTATAQPAPPGREDLSRALLGKLQNHEDPITAKLSKWALRFRFASDGKIRPFLDAAHNDRTY